jgi:hypothetical protein
MKSKITIYLAVMGLLIIAIFIGCQQAKLKGDPVGNQPPSISWSNVPLPDSVFRSNAVMSWLGKDMDGEVNGYFYYVVLSSEVGGDPAAYISQLPEISEWHATDSTVVTVQLYAPDNEQDTLPQYVFVKCIDNIGDYSNIIYRRFSRINHLPVTFIGECPGSTRDSMSLGEVVWCLPETTNLWKGLKISWAGKDTIDFPNDQPDFEYEWKLYGPYDTTSGTAHALTIADTAGQIPLQNSYDSTASTSWVRDKDSTFFGLHTGVYIFVVRVRDDARAADPTAAWRKFMSVEPVWISNPGEERDVLVSQATQFYTTAGLRGYALKYNPPDFPDSLVAFYTQMVENAGYTISIFDTAIESQFTPPPIPVKVLAKYRMVIVDNLDYNKPDLRDPISTNDYCKAFSDYLAIGGRIWVIGRQAFSTFPTSSDRQSEQFSPQTMAFQYFDLDGASYGPTRNTEVAEFRVAKSIVQGFENIGIDSLKCSYVRQFGISKVDVVERAGDLSHTLFTFGAVNPDTSYYNDLPVAVAYEPASHLYKTAYFSFPLYLMDNSEGKVQHVFDVMLAWFLNNNAL